MAIISPTQGRPQSEVSTETALTPPRRANKLEQSLQELGIKEARVFYLDSKTGEATSKQFVFNQKARYPIAVPGEIQSVEFILPSTDRRYQGGIGASGWKGLPTNDPSHSISYHPGFGRTSTFLQSSPGTFTEGNEKIALPDTVEVQPIGNQLSGQPRILKINLGGTPLFAKADAALLDLTGLFTDKRLSPLIKTDHFTVVTGAVKPGSDPELQKILGMCANIEKGCGLAPGSIFSRINVTSGTEDAQADLASPGRINIALGWSKSPSAAMMLRHEGFHALDAKTGLMVNAKWQEMWSKVPAQTLRYLNEKNYAPVDGGHADGSCTETMASLCNLAMSKDMPHAKELLAKLPSEARAQLKELAEFAASFLSEQAARRLAPDKLINALRTLF